MKLLEKYQIIFSKYFFALLLPLTLPSLAQDEVMCFDAKAGLLQTETYAQDFYQKLNREGYGTRERPDGPYLTMAFDKARSQSKKVYCPYLNGTFAIRFNPYFELNVGFSYTQIKSDITYHDGYEENMNTSSGYYYRYRLNADGKLTNHIYRIEFAPVYRIFNTKLIFGIINMDISKSSTNFETGVKTKYNVIYKQNSWAPDHQYPEDSIVTEMSQESFTANYNIKNRYYFPLSIGIEQEIPVKKLRYLVGFKISYARRSYAPLFFYGYLGIRLSKQYTWKE